MCAWVSALAGALWASETRAADCTPDEPLRHRFAAGGGVATTYFIGGNDGYYQEEGPRGGAQLGYSYIPVRGFDVGLDFVFFNGPVILAGGTIRGYLPLGPRDVVELGLGGHFGLHVVRYRSRRTWTASGTWPGPDVRVWATERLGFQLAGQAFLAMGYTSPDRNNPADSYVNETSGFLGLGGAFSVLFRN